MSFEIRSISRSLGLLLCVLSAAMIPAIAVSMQQYYFSSSPWREGADVFRAFLLSMAAGVSVGSVLLLIGQGSDKPLRRRDTLILINLTWVVAGILCSLPFFLWAQVHAFLPNQDTAFLSWVNCLFESLSGLTTTGSSILSNIESIPISLLFWRGFTHWLGGLGIVVLFIVVVPFLSGTHSHLFKVETAPIEKGMQNSIRSGAKTIFFVYSALTLLQVAALKAVEPEMGWIDNFSHAFATIASGGFSTRNASAGAFGPGVQWVCILFMILGTLNFGLYEKLVGKRFRLVFQDTEAKAYLLILTAACVLVWFSIHQNYQSNPYENQSTLIRNIIFQVVSVGSTTGFGTADYDTWGNLAQFALIVVMLIGGSTGSTAGGLKVVRLVALFKIFWIELERAFRPGVVRAVRIGETSITYSIRISVLTYIFAFICLLLMGGTFLVLTESTIDAATAYSAALTAMTGTGPGLALVGPTQNFAWISSLGKLGLCFLMIAGRLEVFPLAALFLPRFWKTTE